MEYDGGSHVRPVAASSRVKTTQEFWNFLDNLALLLELI